MKRDKLIEYGGSFPHQYIALVVGPRVTPAKRTTLPMNTFKSAKHGYVPYAEPPPFVDANCGLSDEDAFKRAVQASIEEVMKQAKQSKKQAPIDLCCPITLEPFEDPVMTIRGQTYERKAIADWLSKSSTDPITGCALKITALWPDKDMRSRVDKFYAA